MAVGNNNSVAGSSFVLNVAPLILPITSNFWVALYNPTWWNSIYCEDMNHVNDPDQLVYFCIVNWWGWFVGSHPEWHMHFVQHTYPQFDHSLPALHDKRKGQIDVNVNRYSLLACVLFLESYSAFSDMRRHVRRKYTTFQYIELCVTRLKELVVSYKIPKWLVFMLLGSLIGSGSWSQRLRKCDIVRYTFDTLSFWSHADSKAG